MIFNFFREVIRKLLKVNFLLFSRESAILKTKISKTKLQKGTTRAHAQKCWLRAIRDAAHGLGGAAGPLGGRGQLAAAGPLGRLAGQRLERRRQLGWLAGLGGCLAAGPLGGGLARGRHLAAGPPASARNAGAAGDHPRYWDVPRRSYWLEEL